MKNYRKIMAALSITVAGMALSVGFISYANDKLELYAEASENSQEAVSEMPEGENMAAEETEVQDTYAESGEETEVSDDTASEDVIEVPNGTEEVESGETSEEEDEEIELFRIKTEQTAKSTSLLAERTQQGMKKLTEQKERVSVLESEIRRQAEIRLAAEEAARKKAAEEAAAKKAAEEAAKKAAEEQAAREQDIRLLAALIYCEAGNQPYEGQVAVGAVVLNRVQSGVYPNSIQEVIYQSGQFGPAMTGWLNTVLANGSYSEAALQAARDAYAGVNPIGDCLYFGCGNYGIRIGAHYFH